MNLVALQVSCKKVVSCFCYFAVQMVYSPSATDTYEACLNGVSKTVRAKHVLKIFSNHPKVERKFISGFLSAKPCISLSRV